MTVNNFAWPYAYFWEICILTPQYTAIIPQPIPMILSPGHTSSPNFISRIGYIQIIYGVRYCISIYVGTMYLLTLPRL